LDWDNPEKSGTIPDDAAEPHGYVVKDLTLELRHGPDSYGRQQ